MPTLFVLTTVFLTQTADKHTLDARTLAQLIDASQAPIEDLYCEYEGRVMRTRAYEQRNLGLDENGIYQYFSGLYLFKQPSLHKVTIFHQYVDSKHYPDGHLTSLTIASTGEQTDIYDRDNDLSRRRHATWTDFNRTGSYGRINLARFLRRMLDYPKMRFYSVGHEQIGEYRCARVAIVIGQPPYELDDDRNMIERFWIDLSRGAQVLQKERISDGRLRSRTSGIKLAKYNVGSRSIWLPIQGRYEIFNYDDRKLRIVEEYEVLTSSLLLNQGMDAERLKPDYSIGIPITDALKGTVELFGQDTRPPPETVADAQERLGSALRQAEESRSELAAASWSRGGWVRWSYWIPMAISAIALFAVVTLILMRRGSA